MPSWYENALKEAQANVKKAKISGCWFINDSGRWLTPEEYAAEAIQNAQSYGVNNPNILTTHRMADPREAIKQKMLKISSLTLDMQRFSDKVFDYFNMTAKDRGKPDMLDEYLKK